MIWLLVGCHGKDEPAIDLQIEVSTPNATAPLVRALHAHAAVPVTLSATWASADHTVSVDLPGELADQERLLVGFRPGQTYHLTVTATDASGRTDTAEADVQTVAAPSHFPVGTIVGGTGERAPGHTLIPMNSFLRDGAQLNEIFVFDEDGRLVYWLDIGDFVGNAQEYDGGILALVGESEGTLVDYAWDGTVRNSWSVGGENGALVSVPAETAEHFHHDVQPDPGDPTVFAAVARFAETVPDYPTSYSDPVPSAAAEVAIDALVVFDATGAIRSETPLDSIVPADRIGFGSLDSINVAAGDPLLDWGHANAVLFDGPDFIVSLRHQDALVKFDPTTREIRWILGYPDNWSADLEQKRLQPIGNVRWTYHQHGPRLAPDAPSGERRLLVFDNGNYRAAPWTGDPPLLFPQDLDQLASRVVQYAIDEDAGTVREEWSFEHPAGGRLYCDAVGEAESLPNGHVSSTWGLLTTTPDGRPNAESGIGDTSVRVIEFDPATLAEVEELYVTTPAATNDKGWTGFRSDRIASLYGRVMP